MKKELQPFGEILKEMPQGKPVLTIADIPCGGSVTMYENEDGTWDVYTRHGKQIVNRITPPDAYSVLFPLFARNWNKDSEL